MNTDKTTRDDAIVAAYEAGETLRSIGADYHLSAERIRQVLAGRSVERRRPGTNPNRPSGYDIFVAERGDEVEAQMRTFSSLRDAVNTLTSDALPKTYLRRLGRERIGRTEWGNYGRRTPRYSDEALLNVLRQYADNGLLSVKRYNKMRTDADPSSATFVLRFGSWSKAIEAAGLQVTLRTWTPTRSWTAEELRTAVSTYAAECAANGTLPTARGYDAWRKQRTGYPSTATLRIQTQMSWTQLLEEVVG